MSKPSPLDFRALPINDADLIPFYIGSDISKPFWVTWRDLKRILASTLPSGSGVLLKTNGVTNPVQTLLNLVAGTNMTISNDGLGNITFTSSGGGGSYTADNGITENSPAPNNFRLGGGIVTPTTITAGSSSSNNGIRFDAPINLPTGTGIYSFTGFNLSGLYNALGNSILASFFAQGAISVKITASESGGITGTGLLIESLDSLSNPLKIKGSVGDTLLFNDNGQLRMHLYNSATAFSGVSGASVGLLNVDNQGKIFVTPAPSGTGTVTSVAATVPSPTNPAFSVAVPNPTTTPSVNITANGVVSQYIRGDGSLANFPSSGGGGSSLNYYLNGSVSQGTLGGVAFRQMSSTPVIGAGTNFSISSDGYIQSFITDASVPNQLLIPAGNWLFEMYFNASSAGGSPRFYIELYKLSAGVLTLIASSVANPEFITNGTAVDLYTTAVAVPSTVLLAADRIAVRVYVIHSGRTITLHTEDSNLCEVITTFSTGITALNGLTAQIQNFATGTSGTDFGITSATDTHTFNLPTASATNRGALSSADYTVFNGKQDALTTTKSVKILTNNVELDGDAASPGNNKVYGTDASGVKGFKSDPVNAALVTLYGAGIDGDVTISVNTTLARDMYYNNLTVNLGVTLNTNGFKVYVKGNLTNAGTIGTTGNNGGNGISFSSPGTGGALTTVTAAIQSSDIFINGSVAGNNGGNGTTTNGSSSSAINAAAIYLGGKGGSGGTGGTGPSGTPGTGGAVTSLFNTIDGKRYINAITENFWLGLYFPFCSIPGTGGGGGAGGGPGSAGGSGGGGGSGCRGVNIHAFSIINSGTIRSIGGNGGNASVPAGVNAGGGGGGGGAGGGFMYLIYGTLANTGTITVAGGAGGLGTAGIGTGGAGANGANGGNGTLIQIDTTLGTIIQS